MTHLEGFATAHNGPGGDGACGGDSNASDSLIYVLPPSARGADLTIRPDGLGTDQLLIAGDQQIVSGSTTLVPGGVYAASPADGKQVILDGITFRASTPATRKVSRGSSEASPKLLKRFGF